MNMREHASYSFYFICYTNTFSSVYLEKYVQLTMIEVNEGMGGGRGEKIHAQLVAHQDCFWPTENINLATRS